MKSMGTERETPDEGWTLVVPVKSLDRAKTRLASVLEPSDRRALVLAMATDVLDACLAAPDVARVRVVSSDPEVARLAQGRASCDGSPHARERWQPVLEIVPEPAAVDGVDPLNAALSAALSGVTGPAGVVAADLPELRAGHLCAVLGTAARHAHSVVPDHHGVGTTMAFWTGPNPERVPRFGTGSASRHLGEGGAIALGDVDPSGAIGRDVDTPGDLDALTGRPVGPATARALDAVSGGLPPLGERVSATMVP